MAEWISKVRSALGVHAGPNEMVVRLLDAARRSRARLELRILAPATSCGAIMAASIEEVGSESLLVSRPVTSGAGRPLRAHDRLHISFVVDSTRYHGETRCLGRARIPSGGKRMLYGYRLLFPEALGVEERRADRRDKIGFEAPPAAELTPCGFETPVRVAVLDLSSGGMQVRSAIPGRFALGQQVYVRADLPEPVGPIAEMGEIAWLRRAGMDGQTLLGIHFLAPVRAIEQYVQHAAESESGQGRPAARDPGR